MIELNFPYALFTKVLTIFLYVPTHEIILVRVPLVTSESSDEPAHVSSEPWLLLSTKEGHR